MSASSQTLAFFGATGGCASTALAAALRDGYSCTALARTPDKLRKLLTTEHSIPASTLDSNLMIHAGNVKSITDVQKALVSPNNTSVLVDKIIFGVGGAPKFQASLMPITLDDPQICESGTSTVLSALSALKNSGITQTQAGKQPVFITISTTGVSDVQRDVPLLMYPLYHVALQVPHADKRKMESLLFSAAGKQIQDFVIIRPTLLTDGAPRGTDKVRAGWEWGNRNVQGRAQEPGPMLGWTVGRKDVGEWIFQEVVKKGGWEGKCASLTY